MGLPERVLSCGTFSPLPHPAAKKLTPIPANAAATFKIAITCLIVKAYPKIPIRDPRSEIRDPRSHITLQFPMTMTAANPSILSLIKQALPDLTSIRHDLHTHPELGFE